MAVKCLRVVSRKKLEVELQRFKEPQADVLLIEMIGEEDKLGDWAYLTNEAVQMVVDRGFRMIALNIPSMDREADGMRTSNHKLIFDDPNRLILESARFDGVPLGPIEVELVLQDLGAFVDCCRCSSLMIRSCKD